MRRVSTPATNTDLFPDTARIGPDGHLAVGGCDLVALAAQHGTPLARDRGVRQAVLLRVGPGVAAHTHAHLQTGAADTKFGLDIASGAAADGVRDILARRELELRGLHMHLGSQIADTEAYREGVERLFRFAAEMRADSRLVLREVSPGGGFAVRYAPDETPVDTPRLLGAVGRVVL